MPQADDVKARFEFIEQFVNRNYMLRVVASGTRMRTTPGKAIGGGGVCCCVVLRCRRRWSRELCAGRQRVALPASSRTT